MSCVGNWYFREFCIFPRVKIQQDVTTLIKIGLFLTKILAWVWKQKKEEYFNVSSTRTTKHTTTTLKYSKIMWRPKWKIVDHISTLEEHQIYHIHQKLPKNAQNKLRVRKFPVSRVTNHKTSTKSHQTLSKLVKARQNSSKLVDEFWRCPLWGGTLHNNDLSIFQKQIKKKITTESSVVKICDTAAFEDPAFEDPFVGG